MAELSKQQISELYNNLENKSNEEIVSIINDINNEAIKSLLDDSYKYDWIEENWKLKFGGIRIKDFLKSFYKDGEKPQGQQITNFIIEICKKYAKKYSSEIKIILQDNPQTTNYILNIIQLLAPAIAQQYSGIPAMAIVGSITILCRQGIDNFIK